MLVHDNYWTLKSLSVRFLDHPSLPTKLPWIKKKCEKNEVGAFSDWMCIQRRRWTTATADSQINSEICLVILFTTVRTHFSHKPSISLPEVYASGYLKGHYQRCIKEAELSGSATIYPGHDFYFTNLFRIDSLNGNWVSNVDVHNANLVDRVPSKPSNPRIWFSFTVSTENLSL